jgi:Putative transposase/Transposase zinc-binding domain
MKKKITIKQIFEDNFKEFWEKNATKYPEDMRKDMLAEVVKMMGCGNIAKGFVAYICMLCLDIHKKGFTCKSRFCVTCGKKYISNWVEAKVNKILDVPHRHCVFTVPEQFRVYFFQNRKGLKDLQDMAHEVITEYANGVNADNRKEYEKKKKRKKGNELWKVGMIGVAHTFSRNLGFNPHVHALVAEIKMKGKEVVEMSYLDYEYLRKVWQYKLINYMIKKEEKKKAEYLKMFKEYKDGFVVYAKSRMTDAKGAARYIGRYLARPAIAEYRIIEYDGKQVKFWYEDHQTKRRVDETLTVEEFMGKLLMHIPPKSFKMARSYGIYAGSIATKIKKCFGLLKYIKSGLKAIKYTLKEYWKKKSKKLSYRELMIRNFSKDPLECKRCGVIMELWEIWHHKYGYIYDLGKC